MIKQATQNKKQLKIGFFGHGPWAHDSLKLIISKKKYEVLFVATRKTGDIELKRLAEKNSIPFFIPSNINSNESIKLFSSFHCDFFVSMSFDQIFKSEQINVPSRGIINCHAGALPFYRGRNVLNWAIINGEKKFGITAHFVDEGIDTGEIICQNFVPINDEDTYSSILQKAYAICPKVLLKGLNLASMNSPTISQQSIHQTGSYFRKRKNGDEWINWNWSNKRVFDFIRAISSPGPRARTLLKNEEVSIERARLIETKINHVGANGEILEHTDTGIIVKTGSSIIEVRDVYFKTGENFPKEELKVGMKFTAEINSRWHKLS